MLYFGFDVGTQSAKGLVLDASAGRVIARASRAYGLIEGLPPGAAEQHPSLWIDAVREVSAELVAVVGSEAAGVGVSGQQHGLVVLDAEDRVVRPAKLWCDTTAAAEAASLSREIGRPIPAGFTAPKVRWMAQHEPSAWARVETVLLPHDYLNFVLTGEKTMEAGDASGTGFFDVARRQLDPRAMEIVDPALPAKVPRLIGAGEPAGRLSARGAELLGLSPGVLISSGGGDNMMSAIGAGATRPGVVVLSVGTSGTVFARSETPVIDPEGLIAPFCDSTGAWLPLLCVMNMTGVLEEVRGAFGGSLEELTARAAGVPPGAEGVTFIPYLIGERVPDLPRATGSILGLRPGLLRAEVLFRAALEGVSLNVAWGVERLRRLGIGVDRVRAVGGGSRNLLWRRILAAAIGAPVEVAAEPESAALGAAIQALWTDVRCTGVRSTATADEIAAPFIRLTGEPVVPDARELAFYREARERFMAWASAA